MVVRASRIPDVGDTVVFDLGSYTATGVIVEDRGHLLQDGGRLLRVRVELGLDADPMFFELPEASVRLVVGPPG